MFCPNYSLTNAASVLEGEQSLVTADGLEQHKVVHINERPFERVDCGNTSKRESELFLHQRDTHSQGKPHRSNSQNCTKAYKRRHTLLAHQGKHQGKKRWFKSDELVELRRSARTESAIIADKHFRFGNMRTMIARIENAGKDSC